MAAGIGPGTRQAGSAEQGEAPACGIASIDQAAEAAGGHCADV
jgi:hypothetical protein